MRTIIEIYEAYHIPPWLQEHQLRVAAVGKLISERIVGVDVDSVVTACLLHDMGNILKFDLRPEAVLASMVPPEQRQYWISVQREFQEKYGTDEHLATDMIVQEVGATDVVRELIQKMGFSKASDALEGGNIQLCVVEYADKRVGPHGILSLEERMADVDRRYAERRSQKAADDSGRYLANIEAEREIERELMLRAGMNAEEISEESVFPVIKALRNFAL